MAARKDPVQAELDEALNDIESARSILEEAYEPEATRAQLASAVGQALEILNEYADDEEEDDAEDGDGDDE
jgi:hypothetical protein